MFERFQRIVADQGITPSEFGILLLVYENDGLSQSDLSKAIRADRSTVVALVDRFEERKMLKRTPSPFDRRSHALRLTELGRSVMDRLIPRVHQHEREIVSRLSSEEQSLLLELLGRIAAE